jgi:hypothetical protein
MIMPMMTSQAPINMPLRRPHLSEMNAARGAPVIWPLSGGFASAMSI